MIDETVRIKPLVVSIEDIKRSHGPALAELQDVAYSRGYSDHAAGRARVMPSSMMDTPRTAAVAAGDSDATERAPKNSSRPSEELAARARKYQDDQAKLGKTISNIEAVTKVYADAGVPLR